jgi:hypothetical protein
MRPADTEESAALPRIGDRNLPDDQDLAAGFAGAGVIATFGASAAVGALGPEELAFVGVFMEEDMSLKLIGNTLHILRQKYAAYNIIWLF